VPHSVASLLLVGILWIAGAGGVSQAAENLFKVLADAGAPVTVVESAGSVLVGRPGLSKMLLEAGVSERWNNDASAAQTPPDADPRLVRLLIKAIHDPNVRFDNGDTALIRAVRQELEEGVELLLDMGADVHLRDSRGRSALSHALHSRNPQVAKMLLGAGADSLDSKGSIVSMNSKIPLSKAIALKLSGLAP